jgi:hypothetical protein
VLLFAAGLGVSQLDVEYAGGALTVRARSAGVSPASAPSGPVVTATAAEVPVSAASLAALEQSLRSELASAKPASSASTEDLLRRVRALIAQSELRQQRELALRLSQVASEVDTQHQADLLRMQQNFGQLESLTGAEIAQQRQLVDYLVKTSGGVK